MWEDLSLTLWGAVTDEAHLFMKTLHMQNERTLRRSFRTSLMNKKHLYLRLAYLHPTFLLCTFAIRSVRQPVTGLSSSLVWSSSLVKAPCSSTVRGCDALPSLCSVILRSNVVTKLEWFRKSLVN